MLKESTREFALSRQWQIMIFYDMENQKATTFMEHIALKVTPMKATELFRNLKPCFTGKFEKGQNYYLAVIK